MMNADTTWSARVVEVCYETNRAIVRFEGLPPEIGADVLIGNGNVMPKDSNMARDAARYRWLKQASKAEYLMARGAFGLDDAEIDSAATAQEKKR